jgi:ERCC4-type nuclease
MHIKIDTRENDLFAKITHLIETDKAFKEIKLISETLLIGDVIIFDEINQKEHIIIERKSINDLLSSIKDGRYEEQSYRLNGLEHNNHNIIYLIEGSTHYTKEKQTVYSAMVSLFYYKGFSVFRSFNTDETAEIICNMAYKLEKEKKLDTKKPYYSNTLIQDTSNELELPSDKNYINLVKKCKKENITVDNIDEIMLSQIPGVSPITAIAIIAKFSNISQLIKGLEENIECLNEISYLNTKGQSRKISKTSIVNIVKYLMKK